MNSNVVNIETYLTSQSDASPATVQVVPSRSPLSRQFRGSLCTFLFEELGRYTALTFYASLELQVLMETYCDMLEGCARHTRVAFPLGTGSGKTTSVYVLAAKLHKEGLLGTPYTMAVCAERVEALADLYRDMVRMGVPAGKIGVIHSKRFDATHAAQVLAGKVELKDGHATVPACADPTSKPVVLFTHERVGRGFDQDDLRRNYRDVVRRQVMTPTLDDGKLGEPTALTLGVHPRHLIIHDESLVTAEASYVNLRNLDEFWPRLKRQLLGKDSGDDNAPERLVAWVQVVRDLIQGELDRQGQGLAPSPDVILPSPSGHDPEAERLLERWRELLAGRFEDDTHVDEHRALLDFASRGVRIIVENEQGNSASVFGIRVPDDLTNIVVLDGSYLIRKLTRADPTIVGADQLHHLTHREFGSSGEAQHVVQFGAAKKWDRLTVHHRVAGGGRETIEAHYKTPTSAPKLYSRMVAEVIHGLAQDQGCVVFTFKRRPRRPDIVKALKADLEALGVDLTQRVPGILADTTKPRVMFATFGQITGSNTFAHCRAVIMLGLLRPNKLNLLNQIIATKRDPVYQVPHEEFSDFEATEHASEFYQTLSRGACRRLEEGGYAKPMDVYVIHKESRLQEDVMPFIPGALWVPWVAAFETRSLLVSDTQRVAKRIEEILAALGAPPRVSTKTIKARDKPFFGQYSAKTFTRSLGLVAGYELEGRTLVKAKPETAPQG